MYPSTLVDTLISESCIYFIRSLANACYLLSLPDFIPTKDILHITLRVRDENAKADD